MLSMLLTIGKQCWYFWIHGYNVNESEDTPSIISGEREGDTVEITFDSDNRLNEVNVILASSSISNENSENIDN
jgi:hypothetical protein